MSTRRIVAIGVVGGLLMLAAAILSQLSDAAVSQQTSNGSLRGEQEQQTTWQVAPPANARAIEGYASAVSVAPGEALEFHVSTSPEAEYRVEIYRIGWYDGAGAARLLCIPADCTTSVRGQTRPVPPPDPATGELRVGWPVTERVVVPADWPSGEYAAKLILTSGVESGTSAAIPFVVRAPASRRSAILVVVPVNTWAAYNDWGGLSTYSDPVAAVKVSFDRPFSHGLAKPTLGYPVARFLDRYGYDVSYTTDSDVDRERAVLANHSVVVVTGHSEYWTKEQRDGLEAARALGTHLVFLGGNTGYWQVRYADAERRVLELYRTAERDPSGNPRQKTVRWRDTPLNRPECRLLGVQWQGGDDASDPVHHPYTVTARAAAHPWLAGTGLRAGDQIVGAVGKEWDAIAPECGSDPTVTTLFHYRGKPTPHPPGVWRSTFHSTNADAVTYTAPSGSVVFNASSIDFGWTLAGRPVAGEASAGTTDPDTPSDPRMERFVRNMLDDLTSR